MALLIISLVPYGNYSGPNLFQMVILSNERISEFEKRMQECKEKKISLYIGEDITVPVSSFRYTISRCSGDIAGVVQVAETLDRHYDSWGEYGHCIGSFALYEAIMEDEMIE